LPSVEQSAAEYALPVESFAISARVKGRRDYGKIGTADGGNAASEKKPLSSVL
jgi:hypothetical protein